MVQNAMPVKSYGEIFDKLELFWKENGK